MTYFYSVHCAQLAVGEIVDSAQWHVSVRRIPITMQSTGVFKGTVRVYGRPLPDESKYDGWQCRLRPDEEIRACYLYYDLFTRRIELGMEASLIEATTWYEWLTSSGTNRVCPSQLSVIAFEPK